MMSKGGVGGKKDFLSRSGLGIYFSVLLITEVCVVDVVGVLRLVACVGGLKKR
jgi:hypothetical protein